jgi:HxlR-like helix-turn-helix
MQVRISSQWSVKESSISCRRKTERIFAHRYALWSNGPIRAGHRPAAQSGAVEYKLTEAGEDLRGVIMSLGIWGQRWVESSLSAEEARPSVPDVGHATQSQTDGAARPPMQRGVARRVARRRSCRFGSITSNQHSHRLCRMSALAHESQIMLCPLRRDTVLENCIFRIFPMYEFLHSQAQKRTHVLQHFRAQIHVAVDCPHIGELQGSQ